MTVTRLGLDRAGARFLPMYEERREWGKLFGGICVLLTAVFGIGLSFAALLVGLRDVLYPRLVHDAGVSALLVVLAVMVPLEAYDDVLVVLFSAFPRAFSTGYFVALRAILSRALWMRSTSSLSASLIE